MKNIGDVIKLQNDPQRIKARLIELLGGVAGMQDIINKMSVAQIEAIAEKANEALVAQDAALVQLREDVFQFAKARAVADDNLLIVCGVVDWLVGIIESMPNLEDIPQLDAVYQLFWNTEMRNRVYEAILEVMEHEAGTTVQEKPAGSPAGK